MTMEDRLDAALARPRFYSTAIRFFAAFALLLAVLGIYAAVSYAVAQRTREMGVRLALGGMPAGLRAMLLRRGVLTVAAGAFPGIACAALTGRLLERLIEGARPVDPATAAASILFILVTASISIWAATRRIARLDVIAILRAE
jgi:ABC-type antimicrobial peptide transport system permease subunit